MLVVEISDSTLVPDQTTKAGLYARAGIREYWIVNLPERLLEVHRELALSETALLGYSYAQISLLTDAETVKPLAAPNTEIAVADLLP